MKIKKIAAIAKKWKNVDLITRFNNAREIRAQYIRTNNAIYPLQGMPVMDTAQLLTVFDIPSEKQSDWTVNEVQPDESLYSLADVESGEEPVKEIPIVIISGVESYQPVLTSQGVVLIPEEVFAPLDLGSGMYELFERVNGYGELYLVAKVGMLLQGVIFLQDYLTETFMETFRMLYRGIETSYEGTMERAELRLEQTRRNLGISAE